MGSSWLSTRSYFHDLVRDRRGGFILELENCSGSICMKKIFDSMLVENHRNLKRFCNRETKGATFCLIQQMFIKPPFSSMQIK